ncbi:MAG: S4 domain-containing protein, partial [Orrella sp.]
RFHSNEDANNALQDFETRFSKNAIPDEMPEFMFDAEMPLANLLKEAGLVATTSEAHRMIKQGAVKLNGERLEDGRQIFSGVSDQVFQVGKRKFARVTVG